MLCQIGMHDSAAVELTNLKVDAYIHKHIHRLKKEKKKKYVCNMKYVCTHTRKHACAHQETHSQITLR